MVCVVTHIRPLNWNIRLFLLVIVTRSKAKQSEYFVSLKNVQTYPTLAPHEYSQIPFKLKALKLIINGLQMNGEAATLAAKNPEFDAASSNGVGGLTIRRVIDTHKLP